MPLTREQKIYKIRLLEEKQRRLDYSKMERFKPYPWQLRYFAAGKNHKQRMLMAANQVGKTLLNCYETCCHITGIYPDWWPGVTFDFPITSWACGVSGEQIRDVLQKQICGQLSGKGFVSHGLLPPNLVVDFSRGMTPKLVKDLMIKHVSGKTSHLSFKSYSQGQHALMGPVIDHIQVDEEPTDEEIYGQLLTRTLNGNRNKGGYISLGFTPENGRTKLVSQFTEEIQEGQYFQNATWDDAPHLTEETKAQILSAYPAYQRDMRSKGLPLQGTGLVYQIDEQLIKEDLEHIPEHWARIVGIDIGYNHNTALVWMAYDRDTDTIHIYDIYRGNEGEANFYVISGILTTKGKWIPVAWPHDTYQHDRTSQIEFVEIYKNLGVNMLHAHSTFENGSNGREAGIMSLHNRMLSGRIKVASHLAEWFEEFRQYHRKNGIINRVHDDLLDATRYAEMMLRYAVSKYENELPEIYEDQEAKSTGYW